MSLLALTCPTNQGVASIWWLDYYFNLCAYSWIEVLSEVLGAVSLAHWLVAILPQIVENWQRKSTDGLSLGFLLFWFVGDTMNYISCLILRQRLFQKLLSIYFVLTDTILFIQMFIYRSSGLDSSERPPAGPSSGAALCESDRLLPQDTANEGSADAGCADDLVKPRLRWRTPPRIAAAVVAAIVVLATVASNDAVRRVSVDIEAVGFVLAWSSTFAYHFSRIPQLILNWRRKSVEGLSLAMFGIIFSGNAAYASSLLLSVSVHDHGFFVRTFPFIYGSIGSMVFDVFVLLQFYMLNGKAPVDANGTDAGPALPV